MDAMEGFFFNAIMSSQNDFNSGFKSWSRSQGHPQTIPDTTYTRRASFKVPKPSWGNINHQLQLQQSFHTMDEEIFRNMDHCALRGDIATLKDGSKVEFALVDAWTCVLNYRELTKANSA
nr:hypothetical protein Iba_chr14eCG5480 [Ipomoea batatas]